MVKVKNLQPILVKSLNYMYENGNGTRCFIENLPPCVYVGYEQSYLDCKKKYFSVDGFGMKTKDNNSEKEMMVYKQLSQSNEFIYTKQCEQCVYRKVCIGLFQTYIKKFGSDDIIPVDYFTAIQNLNKKKLKTKVCLP